MEFERIYWLWRMYEAKGKDIIFKELDELVSCGEKGLDALFAYDYKLKSLYNICIEEVINPPKGIVEFFKGIKKVSEKAYIFATDGHDILNLKKYFKFEDVDSSMRFEKCKEFIDFSRHIRYVFKKMLNESEEKKKKIMLKGILGI